MKTWLVRLILFAVSVSSFVFLILCYLNFNSGFITMFCALIGGAFFLAFLHSFARTPEENDRMNAIEDETYGARKRYNNEKINIDDQRNKDIQNDVKKGIDEALNNKH